MGLLALGATAALPAHADTLPFSGDFFGGITSFTSPTPTTQDIFATASSTNASFGLDQESDHYFLTNTGNGNYTLTPGTTNPFTFASTDGSSIFGTYTSIQGSNHLPGQQQQFIEALNISGGTGQFAGATGSLIATNGLANYQGNSGTSHLSGSIITPSAAVPEPGSLALFGLGLPGLVLLARKRRSRNI